MMPVVPVAGRQSIAESGGGEADERERSRSPGSPSARVALPAPAMKVAAVVATMLADDEAGLLNGAAADVQSAGLDDDAPGWPDKGDAVGGRGGEEGGGGAGGSGIRVERAGW